MSMTVGDLLDLLQDLPPDTELRVAHQPSWPLALTVAAVRVPGDLDSEAECPYHEGFLVGHIVKAEDASDTYMPGDRCTEQPDEDPRDRCQHVWIVGIDHPYDESPYAPRWVFEE